MNSCNIQTISCYYAVSWLETHSPQRYTNFQIHRMVNKKDEDLDEYHIDYVINVKYIGFAMTIAEENPQIKLKWHENGKI